MPALVGRRLTVYDIVTKIYYEDGVKIALDDYEISIADAKDALNYCMSLFCKEDKNRVHFCDGCVLRTFEEGNDFKKDNYTEIEMGDQKIVVSTDEKVYFIGSLQEFEDSEFGKVTWLMAEEVNRKIQQFEL
jgi:uncharacterized protein (DUF433 family)